MEPKNSLPHSQVPATCPYSEPARSSPFPTYHFLKIHFNIILPSTPGSPKWSLSLGFPPKPCIRLSFPPIRATCPAHIIFLEVIARSSKYSPQHPIFKHPHSTFLPHDCSQQNRKLGFG